MLSQDAYGAGTSVSLRTSDFPVPGLAVGRLVETPAEIAGVLDAYTQAGGVVAPASSLVTGYDFLADAAGAVQAELQAGTGAASDLLVTPADKSPQDPASWTASQLSTKLLGSRHDVIFLAGHFSANSALAADFTTSLLTTDLAASTVDLTNALVFSAGCHAGYNLVDGDAVPAVTQTLDWAQAFARKRATLVAGTGYQYGDTDFLEYSERLYRNFARELRAGTGAVSVGEALVKAKLDYLATTPDIRGLHEKALLEAAVFGLPMLGVNMPAGRTPAPPSGGAITPVPVASGPAATLGLRTFDLGVSPGLTTNTDTLTNVSNNTLLTATWLSGPDGVVTNPAEPALPLDVVNVTPTDSSVVLRGVGFRGGTFADSTVVPLTGAPTTELRGVHAPFVSPVFFPMRLATVNYFGALGGSGGTNLLVTPGTAPRRERRAGDEHAAQLLEPRSAALLQRQSHLRGTVGRAFDRRRRRQARVGRRRLHRPGRRRSRRGDSHGLDHVTPPAARGRRSTSLSASRRSRRRAARSRTRGSGRRGSRRRLPCSSSSSRPRTGSGSSRSTTTSAGTTSSAPRRLPRRRSRSSRRPRAARSATAQPSPPH